MFDMNSVDYKFFTKNVYIAFLVDGGFVMERCDGQNYDENYIFTKYEIDAYSEIFNKYKMVIEINRTESEADYCYIFYY